MSIPGDLEHARRLAFADDHAAARDLLLSLMPDIERADRDDLMLEVFAQLGDVYLVRGANNGVQECIARIDDCLTSYRAIAAGELPEAAAQVRMSESEIERMVCRYARHAQFLRTTLAAVTGDHDGAEAALALLSDVGTDRFPDLQWEHTYLRTYAATVCASTLCDDDLHVRSAPLWQRVLTELEHHEAVDTVFMDRLRVVAGTAYGRFCVDTGRLAEADPWLRRADARSRACGWDLATARTSLERAAASWRRGDHLDTERSVMQGYPVIARHARAADVARCWLYLGLTRMAAGALAAADDCFGHAERHSRELGKPLPLHRILLQRSWIEIFRGRFAAAVELVAQARECLDSAPRANWLHYARLDAHLGTVWRADALADLGFDGSGDPADTCREAETKFAGSRGVINAEPGSPRYRRALPKLEQAADLMVPAALAVDAVRYSIADSEARVRWATGVSAPLLAAAFAVAWEWGNTELVSELVEYHSARGSFSAQPQMHQSGDWTDAATATVPLEAVTPPRSLTYAAGGVGAGAGDSAGSDRRGLLTRLGPLPPLRMHPASDPILERHRTLALQRYGREVTADEPAWSTYP